MATATASKPQPVQDAQLQKLAQEACDATFSTASGYIHTQTEEWNSSIIVRSYLPNPTQPNPLHPFYTLPAQATPAHSKILNALLTASSASSTSSESPPPQYKYAVNSTIIQHLTPSSSSPADSSTDNNNNNASASTQTPSAVVPGEQTISPPGTPGVVSQASSVEPQKGRRGMHSATGAYWNDQTDGMWNFKWEGGEGRGMDVVVSVIWVAV
ncbi:MAG: hypothetical protein M1828_007129 [Chrysothrix sp. TS-e1954]|nr:MAG: hypothetical protein M1828_007129 [Chrysothrix sp. TS-e1954]